MKLVRYLRSLDTIPKWMMVVTATGFTWFLLKYEQYHLHYYIEFLVTCIVALASCWVLFGFKSSDKE
jgi:hypothetical protein